LLAFLRQRKGTDHDWAAAEAWISNAGWRELKFERAGTLEAERMTGQAEYLVHAFETAIRDEFGFVVYDQPLKGEEAE
jgi:imidazoleglycerol phosphate synthase glutamine amidotransferase subunit HisH